MSDLTFLFYLDACRYDYLTAENAPFLWELGMKGHMKRARTVAGFTQGAAMLTGKYPDETNRFTWFRYSPERSPFAWIKPFGCLSLLTRSSFYDVIKAVIRKTTSFATGIRYPDPAHVPLDLLPYFENIGYEVPAHVDNLGSMCASSGRRCLDLMLNFDFIGTRRFRELFDVVYKSILDGEPYDVYMMHVGELDMLGHRFGPTNPQLRICLRGIDEAIRHVHELAVDRGHTCNFVIASDHGMQTVAGMVDIEGRLHQLKLKLHRDYVYFLDSTIARFWFFNDNSRDLIEQALDRTRNGHIVSCHEKRTHHIDFNDNSYGDLLYWVDRGHIIFPNFFQRSASDMPKGMHGYMEDIDGVVLIYSDKKHVDDLKDPIPIVDVFAIVSAFAGLTS